MADIQAFRGLRYNLGQVGALSNVIAPPYDVIGAELQDQLYKKHPCNVVRLDLNRQEPGDDEHNNKYSRAARFLKNWQSEGVLTAESQPAVYVYHQTFTVEGTTYTRRGFMARCRLEKLGAGNIFPHEETLSGPKQDRLLLTRATRANLSQIFGLFPDPENAAQTLLDQATVGVPPLEATDHLGVVSKIWPISDLQVINQVAAIMGPKPVFIADGHHRYETSCNYRDELIAAQGELPSDHPANFVMMMFVSMSDPGLIVLPTHRLFRGLAPMTSEQLAARLGDCFKCQVVGEGPDLAESLWDQLDSAGEQGTLALFTEADQRWTLARVTPAGADRMAKIAGDHSTDWRELGVALLHRLLMDELLAPGELPKPKYVHSVAEVIDSLVEGDQAGRDSTGVVSEGGQFELAALVMPATVEHIRTISQHGERMPAKSTYFYPKLLAGLVINPLE